MSKVVIKSRDVRLEVHDHRGEDSTQVELLRDDGVVHAIRVLCACGKSMVIELEYAEAAPASRTEPKK